MTWTTLLPHDHYNIVEYGADPTGANDSSTSIQDAVNAASGSPGAAGVVFVPGGTFLIGTAVTVPSNVTILGTGRGSILKAKAATQPNIFDASSSSHVVFSRFTIDGNKANVTQLAIQYTTLNGIYLHSSDDVVVEDCYIHDCYVSGIMANGGCTNLQFRNNRLLNNFDNQIYVRAFNTTPYTPCTSGTIVGNVCSGGSFSGIQILGSSYFTVTGNTCYSNGPTQAQGDGIGTEGASYIEIVGNVCYSNGVQGIQTRFTSEVGANQISSHIGIVGNICYNNTNAGGDNGGIGINDSDDILVDGNFVYSNTFGINLNGGTGLGVTNCKLVNNKVRSNSDTGIRINPGNASTFVLENNESADNAHDQYYLSQRVHMIGGIAARAPTNYEGLHFASGSDGSLVKNMEIFDNADNGILIDSPVANMDIRDCSFDNITTSSQKRAVQEQAGAGPTRIANCRIKNQSTNQYVFNNTASGYYDEQTTALKTVTANYTVGANDSMIFGNQSAAITVTLPVPTGMAGREIRVKDKAGNAATFNITINVASAGTIDAAASKTVNSNYGKIQLVTDGTQWYTF